MRSSSGDYTASLQTLAVLHSAVDAFFDDVMVNAEEMDLRLNRQGLLKSLHDAMNRVADLSRLATRSSRRRRTGRRCPAHWMPLRELNHAGFHVVVASNQPGLGRGLIDVATLNTIHSRMHKMLAAVGAKVDAVFFCPHTADDGCTCRKPLPGLFEQIGERYGLDLHGVAACGDSLEHLLAAQAAGCETHLVLTGKAAVLAGHPLPDGFPSGTQVHADLGAFASHLIARQGR
jgi:D-glycero-D-manno-heptose 1,7-bisphosphate phosphatase